MENFKGKKIIIFQQRSWGLEIGVFLAKKLHDEGCLLAAVTSHRRTHNFILEKARQDGFNYEMVVSHDDVMSQPKEYLADNDYSMEEMANYLGIDSIWPLVANNRLFARSYKDKFYYGFKQNLSDEEIVLYFKAVYKMASEFFNKFKPDIIIAPNFVGLYHMIFNLFAKKNGIKMIALTDCKIKGMSIFSHSYRGDEGAFYNRVNELNLGKVKSENLEQARQYIKEFRQEFKKPVYMLDASKKTLIKRIRHFGSPYYHILRWYWKRPVNPWKNIGISVDWRPPKIILRDHYSRDRYIKFANNFKYFPFENLKHFAYFPLQYQPEETIDVIAPFFSNQIEVARLIAMSLPNDLTLVVKDHPAMLGLRPPSYLEKLDRTVNVKLIDYRIPSEKILKNMEILISPSGTSLAEAAFYNKPVIQLGNLGTTLKLPNVFKYTDFTNLSKKIKEVLAVNLETEDYERRLENFVAAAFDTGFNLDYVAIWERGEDKDKLEFLWETYRKEIERVIR